MNAVPHVRLGDLMRQNAENLDPRRFAEEIFELYSIPAFDVGLPEIVLGSAIGSAKQIVAPGDVLLSRIVPHIRRSWVVGRQNAHRQIASGEWIVFRTDKADARYLRHLLVSDDFHERFMMTVAGVGGSLLRARPKQVAEIKVPLPPLPEQRRIAAILDEADALRAKRRAALAQLEEMAQAIFVEMFGDPASNPSNFPVVRVGDLLLIPPNFGSMAPPHPNKGDWLSLRVANIQDWKLSLHDQKFIDLKPEEIGRFSVQDGDLVIARAIASIEHLGKSIVVFPGDARWAFDSHLMRARFNKAKASPVFIRDFFQSKGGRSIFLKSTRKTTVQYNINTKEFSSLKIPLPPIDMQHDYVAKISTLQEQAAMLEISCRSMDSLFTSLQHRAFRGEL